MLDAPPDGKPLADVPGSQPTQSPELRATGQQRPVAGLASITAAH
jgi:hypothetical protein